MSSLNPFAACAGHNYLNLETFRKNGGGVRTPVWFAAALPEVPGAAPLYVYTIGNTGKLKRIRNNVRVRIVPCDMRGRLLGEWMEARAEILDGAEAEKGMKLLNRKRSEEHTSELQSRLHLVCRLLLEKKKKKKNKR